MTALTRAGQILRALAALAVLIAALAGLPWLLWKLAGWPLPRQIPTGADLVAVLTRPIDDQLLINTLACLAWLAWTVFALDTVIATTIGIRDLRQHTGNGEPDQLTAWGERRWGLARISAVLVGAVLLALAPPRSGHLDLAATAATAAATAPHKPPSPDAAGQQDDTARASMLALLVARHSIRHDYVAPDPGLRHVMVREHDNLWCIAERELGDPRRWHEIHQLNRGRLQPDGQRLRDPDLIHPGWILRLPEHAQPEPTKPRPEDQQTGKDAAPPTAAAGSATPTPARSTPPAPPAPSTPGPTAPASAASPTTTSSAPSSAATPRAEPPSPQTPGARPSEDGIQLPSSFLPWSLASAVTASIALLWLQRRRRHRPGDPGDDPLDLPAPLLDIHRQTTANPDLPSHADPAEAAADVPTPDPLPPGGVGLVGDGAHATARALLVAALTSGGPRDPDAQGEVVIDGPTLGTLIGADAAALGPWPRLHVTDDLDAALTLLDTRLLHRSRILDDHAVTDLDTLRTRAPDEEPLPPVLLITEAPAPGIQIRLRTTLTLGAELQINAALLGRWPHGSTVEIDADGNTNPGGSAQPPGRRLAVLDTATTVAILTAVREAHTGERPATHPSPRPAAPDQKAAAPTTPVPPVPSDSDGKARQDEPAQAAVKADLRTLGGVPRVTNAADPARPLRAKAAELAAFLACHPDGADTRTVGEHLEPDVRLRSADVRVHTNVSNLRHVLGTAAGHRKSGHVLKIASRYRLDPLTVDVDLWHMRDLLTRAATAPTTDRIRLLREACDLYTGPLADGCDYAWIEPHRERARQQATDAHLQLADALVSDDPQAASNVLDRAIRLDRYNEELYRQAMHARHCLGDPGGVRALLRALTIALADLDAEPDETTIRLAHRLASPDQGHRLG